MLRKQRCGIYVSETGVFVARARREMNRIQIVTTASSAFSGSGMDIPAVIRQTLAKAGVAPDPAILCLKGDQTFLKYFEVPVIFRGKELDNVIRFEARKHSPFPIQELECGFQTVTAPKTKETKSASSKKTQVFFSAIRRDNVLPSVQWIDDSASRLEAVEPQAICLARLLAYATAPTKTPAPYVLIFYKEANGAANFVITKQGIVAVSRFGLFPGDVSALLMELRATLDYFSRTFKGEKIEFFVPILDASEATLAEAVTKEFGLRSNFEILAPLFSGKVPALPELFCAIGAALRGLSWTEKTPINLFRRRLVDGSDGIAISEIDRRQAVDRLTKQTLLQTIVVACFFAVLYMLLRMPVNSLENERRALRQKSDGLGVSIGENMEEISARETQYMQKMEAIKTLPAQRMVMTEKLNEISALLPEGAWLSRVYYVEHGIRDGKMARSLAIEGWALSQDQSQELEIVNRFASSLAANKKLMQGFDDVKILSVQRQNTGTTMASQFSVICRAGKAQ